MSTIKTLRASGSQMRADVVVGSNQYGSDVTVSVSLSRNDPEVATALEPLTSLLSARAQSLLEDSAVERRVQERVRAEVKDRTAAERERIAAQANSRLEQLLLQLGRLVGTEVQGDLAKWKADRIKALVTAETAALAGRKDVA